MKIDWSTLVTILIALVAFKLLDVFVLDKAVNKLEEVI